MFHSECNNYLKTSPLITYLHDSVLIILAGEGVTNIGERCYGKKVDGALHNGGNKSMTSNDFTQVLSDGIGAHILNNARAELVSVFTYYCAVGYLAESGGVIRATNGNNSYGSFGSVADGNDPLGSPPPSSLVQRRGATRQLWRGK